MANLFRGPDRRVIAQTIRDLVYILKRDQKALDTKKKTQSISTRDLILDDPAQLISPLSDSAGVLINALKIRLTEKS